MLWLRCLLLGIYVLVVLFSLFTLVAGESKSTTLTRVLLVFALLVLAAAFALGA